MMNGRHLPAGQGMQQDMSRRRPYTQNQQYPQGTVMYNAYINPYNANFYPQQLPPQYHNAGVPHQYAPYPPYGRSPPPPMQHYAAIVQQPYGRPQPSSSISTPYQPPPPQPASSTHSSHTAPLPMTPPKPQIGLSINPSSPPPETQWVAFKAPLPWLSRPDLPWPARRARRKRRQTTRLATEAVELPIASQKANNEPEEAGQADITVTRPETPSTSHPASEGTDSTNPTTPSSIQHQSTPAPGDATPLASKPAKKSTLPAVPVIPAILKPAPRDASKAAANEKISEDSQPQQSPSLDGAKDDNTTETSPSTQIVTEEVVSTSSPPRAWSAPKLWTGLFNQAPTAPASAANDTQAALIPGVGKTNVESLAETLKSFNAVSKESRVAFLEPRGLINAGNMCYMNSVLQVLVFCMPFYNFLDQVSKRATHRFKSDTPLIDAMIMFMREYPVIDSAASVEKLRLRLKEGELEQYGESFTPDFVYDVIRRLPRFASMRRGHQQDAEEFLGFLLEGLHDECVQVMRVSASNTSSATETPKNGPSSPASEVGSSTAGSVSGDANGWLEVGPKQKAAVTRSSGTIITGSPVTKIFGGSLRSELRVPGLKDSVTLEPYQPLQLDIGAPQVNNIIDALKGLTRSEPLHGDFKSPKGPNVTATKQVFIETVPPVLILHLKRFQYDNAGGTQKIWKKVGYPLELEIPKEVFPRQKRSVYTHGGLPKYRLTAVVYHHGKNASGGHYTVDVRRQEGREWIRLDDTVIRRVRSEDVAEAGSEEDPKVLAATIDAQKKDTPASGNIFASIEDDNGDGTISEDGWKQANGPGKKWSSVVNGTSASKSKNEKFSVKDNKVAYLLFYQKISG